MAMFQTPVKNNYLNTTSTLALNTYNDLSALTQEAVQNFSFRVANLIGREDVIPVAANDNEQPVALAA